MTHVPRLHPQKVASGSIATLPALCNALDITAAELAEALALSPHQRYRRAETDKRDGSKRVVHNPHHLIRKIQRRINRRIFANSSVIRWPDHVFGSIPNDDLSISPASDKDYVNCARQHCGAKSILSVDIKDFFDNIHFDLVESVFQDFLKYGPVVSKTLANICCNESHLVQGALTSSYIATLCLFHTEGDLVRRFHHKGLVYTRLVDDITISSKRTNFNFDYALAQVEGVLSDAALPLNSAKTRTQRVGMAPMLVHGLRVDFDQPRLPPDEPGRIRASVKNLELLAASPGYRASRTYRKDFDRCQGRVNKLARVKHGQHKELLKRLRRILPLASHMDIERADRQVSRLERDFIKPGYFVTYWYHKRFHVALQRLGILNRSFPSSATALKLRLSAIRPPKYE